MNKLVLFFVSFLIISVSHASTDCAEVLSRFAAISGAVTEIAPAVEIPGKNSCKLRVTGLDTNLGVISLELDDLSNMKAPVYYYFSALVDQRPGIGQLSSCQSDAKSSSASGGTMGSEFSLNGRPVTQSFSATNLPSAGIAGGSFTMTNSGNSFTCQF